MWPWRSRKDADIRREIDAHLRLAVQDRVDRGEAPDEARRRAALELGNRARTIEEARAVWRWTTVEALLNDLRAGTRILTHAPAMSVSAILLIALVIGGNTSIYSAVRAIVAKPAPGVTADGLVSPGWTSDQGSQGSRQRYADFRRLEAESRTTQLAGFITDQFALTTDQGTYSVHGEFVSGRYFDVLGQRAILGRLLGLGDEGGTSVATPVVIGHRLWRSAFHSRQDLIGQSVTLDGRPAAIVGVVEAPFQGAWMAEMSELWVPIDAARLHNPLLELDNAARTPVEAMVGRLVPKATLAEARAELATLGASLAPPDNPDIPRDRRLTVFEYSGTAARSVQITRAIPAFLNLFSVVTFLTLIIVSANVSNLLMARALSRQRELAVRQTLGAPRSRLVRLVLAEGLSLGLCAWAMACLFAWWTSRALPSLVPPSESGGAATLFDFSPDWKVLGYAMLLAVTGVVVFSLAPALRAWRADLVSFLKSGEQAGRGDRKGMSRILVGVQLAFAVMLLTLASLAVRSLTNVGATELGFDPNRLTVLLVETIPGGQDTHASHRTVIDRLVAHLRDTPGIAAAGYSWDSPVGMWAELEVSVAGTGSFVGLEHNVIDSGYLETLGLPLLAGRLPRSGAGNEMVLSVSAARRLWPEAMAALGQPVQWKRQTHASRHEGRATIVGLVPDAFYNGPRAGGPPAVALAGSVLGAEESAFGQIFIRMQPGSEPVTDWPGVLRGIDAQVAVLRADALAQLQHDYNWMTRALTLLLSLFGLGSLAIAGLGQYAAMAFAARRRTRELAVRIALGAPGLAVVQLVAREGVLMTLAGLSAGVAGGIAVARVARSLLPGAEPADPVSLSWTCALLAVASIGACVVPAIKATRVDPLKALRED